MSDLDDIEDVFEGWLEKPVEEDVSKNKGWLKKSFAKKWKKGYYVLRKYCAGNQPFLQWFDKEDGWRRQMPRGTIELFPRYKVFKRAEHKAKQFVFEISTDAESLLLAAESETVMDLWVIQLQMQTLMNPRIGGEVFRVRGSGNRQMQRIGARDQQCLLHISKWGLTLALERTRAVLAQWPLTTIRNYESLDANEFIFEAGRASPMGEGKYDFFTQNGDDNRIFDVIDSFASARLRRQQGVRSPAPLNHNLTDDDIERAYDQLRFSVSWQSTASGPPFSRDGTLRNINPTAPQSIDVAGSEQSMYNHLGRSDSIGSAHSLGGVSLNSESNLSYNRLDRLPSWGSRASHATDQYNRLNPVPSASSIHDGTYDRLARSPSTSSRTSVPPLDRGLQKEEKPPLPLKHLPRGKETSKSSVDNVGIRQPVRDLTSSKACAPESSDGKSKVVEPHSLPASSQRMTNLYQESPEKGSFAREERKISVVGSPNFVYLNAANSSSVEVLPHVYATVDPSKMKKNRQQAQMASDSALVHTRRKSKSSDSILSGSPSSPPKYTHFGAFAANNDDSKALDDTFFPIIPPQKPRSERVSLANTVSPSDYGEGKAEFITVAPELPAKKGSYTGQVEILERTLSEMSNVSWEGEKKDDESAT